MRNIFVLGARLSDRVLTLMTLLRRPLRPVQQPTCSTKSRPALGKVPPPAACRLRPLPTAEIDPRVEY